MGKLKYLLTLLICVFMLSGTARSLQLSLDGKGDVLIFPVYAAFEQVDTKFTIINTSDTLSTVAKVVFYSHKNSQEVRDFLIYLSPTDVFTMTVKYEGGKVKICSTDDSVLASKFKESSDGCIEVAYPKCEDDSALIGYVVVFDGGVKGLGTPPVDKETIKEDYSNFTGWTTCDTGACNILVGYAELNVATVSASYRATALKNYGINEKLSVQAGLLTNFGKNYTDGYTDTNVCDVDYVLAKNNLVYPYYDEQTLAILTFPTKETVVDDNCTCVGTASEFVDFSDCKVTYKIAYYDLEENTPEGEICEISPCNETESDSLPEEVNMVLLDSPYDEGWAKVVFTAGNTTCTSGINNPDNNTYAGAPVIGLGLTFTPNGGMTFFEPAFKREGGDIAP